jgi:hypothetical protein
MVKQTLNSKLKILNKFKMINTKIFLIAVQKQGDDLIKFSPSGFLPARE